MSRFKYLALVGACSMFFVSTASAQALYGPEAGEWEIALNGSGVSDRRFDSGSFGIGGSIGYFFTENWEAALRQDINFADAEPGGTSWRGRTVVALDYNFNLDRWRPFLGAHAGGVYGNGPESGVAGLEGGVKYYVRSKTFIFGMASYGWSFDSGGGARDNFDDGQFNYTVGIGFNI